MLSKEQYIQLSRVFHQQHDEWAETKDGLIPAASFKAIVGIVEQYILGLTPTPAIATLREQPASAQIDWIPGPPQEDGQYLIAYCDYYGEEKVSANPTYYVNDPLNASDNITHHAAWPQYPTAQPAPSQPDDDERRRENENVGGCHRCFSNDYVGEVWPSLFLCENCESERKREERAKENRPDNV